MSDWLNAFDGIDYKPQAGTPRTLKEVVSPRLRNRLDTDCVRIPIGTLYDIAKRINAQSERIAFLEGAGATLTPESLAAYEAQQAEAERAAAKTGVLFEDLAADDGWSALYGKDGRLVTQDHTSNVRDLIVNEGWQVHRVSAEGIMFDWSTGADPTPDDLQEFPDTLAMAQHAYGRFLRARTVVTEREALDADEPARVPENPITGEPGDG
jgi:hypothetical protein